MGGLRLILLMSPLVAASLEAGAQTTVLVCSDSSGHVESMAEHFPGLRVYMQEGFSINFATGAVSVERGKSGREDAVDVNISESTISFSHSYAIFAGEFEGHTYRRKVTISRATGEMVATPEYRDSTGKVVERSALDLIAQRKGLPSRLLLPGRAEQMRCAVRAF